VSKLFSDPADRLVSGVAFFVSALAAVVLIGGWGLGIERLRTFAPVWSAMAPLTAVLLILVSISMVFLERRRGWANVAMVLTALIAAAVLAEYLLDFDVGFLRLMNVFDPLAELPAPDSAAAFLLLTLALLCWRTAQARLHDFADVVAVLIGLVCLQVLLAYAYNVIATSSWQGFRQIAPHSTIAVGLLAIAATARRPTLGLYGSMRGSAQSALQLRRLLPATVVFCVIIGLLHTMAVEAHVAGIAAVAAWTVIAATTGLAVLLFITSADLRKVEASQEPVHGGDEPRAAHSADRSHRIRQPAGRRAGRRSERGSEEVCGPHPRERLASGRADRLGFAVCERRRAAAGAAAAARECE
jgi:hypothetical protein